MNIILVVKPFTTDTYKGGIQFRFSCDPHRMADTTANSLCPPIKHLLPEAVQTSDPCPKSYADAMRFMDAKKSPYAKSSKNARRYASAKKRADAKVCILMPRGSRMLQDLWMPRDLWMPQDPWILRDPCMLQAQWMPRDP